MLTQVPRSPPCPRLIRRALDFSAGQESCPASPRLVRVDRRPLVQSIDSRPSPAMPRPAKGPVTRTVTDHDLVLVVDFGAQYAQLIARRVREARVYSEIVPHTMPVAEMLARGPKAIILSGGPSSVYEPGAPNVDAALFDGRRPGVRHVLRLPGDGAATSAARYDATGRSEYGRTPVEVTDAGTLLADVPRRAQGLDEPRRLGRRGARRASTCSPPPRTPRSRPSRTSTGASPGVQWHPEVLHTEHGQEVLEPLPARHRRLPADLDDGQHRRGAGRARSAPRSATGGRSAGCPAGSTPRSRRRSCSAPSATS